MLSGVSGSLIQGAFLAGPLVDELSSTTADLPRTLRALHRWWRSAERQLGPASAPRRLADLGAHPLLRAFDYRLDHLEPHGDGFVGTVTTGTERIALRVTPWGGDADAAWRDTVRAGRVLGARWGLVYTGERVAIVDITRPWARRSLTFVLSKVLRSERSALAFTGVMRALVADRSAASCLEQMVQRSEHHGQTVCRSLGQGVLEAVGELLAALDGHERTHRGGGGDERATFEQAVTIAYRILFLLFAEAHAVVPTWHHVYRDSYSIDALWRRTTTPAGARGLWKALQAVSRLAHVGCRAGDLVVTPFNGRLFSPRQTPLGEVARVADAVAARAVVSLATAPGRGGRERIAYADLGVEQLGAVYERVLEYEPTRRGGVLRLAHTSHERKTSGSFYTPRAMTDFLVRRALHPLIAGKSAEEILRLRVLDPAMGSGAFLVAACRYLSDAVIRALAAAHDSSTLADERLLADTRRAVAQRCLFGVDRNRRAVQLARVSLWLTTLCRDRPLTFLDHHLRVGDSLIGATMTDLARAPSVEGRRSTSATTYPSLFAHDPRELLAVNVLPARFRLAVEPGDTPVAVRKKEHELRALSAPGSPLMRWKAAADLWCAAWWSGAGLSTGVYRDLLDSLLGGSSALSNEQRQAPLARAATLAADHAFFHWELEFPEVFFDADGRPRADAGFDAVLGNPPWDVLRADTGDRSTRDRARTEHGSRLRFFRQSHVYKAQGGGHPNQYQLFLERTQQLTRPGGRLALVLPSGLATDLGSAKSRQVLFEQVDIERLIGFDNRQGIFPIHRDTRFLLLTGTKGAPSRRVVSVLGRSDVTWLDRLPDAAPEDPEEARGVTLSLPLIASWDPSHVTIPWLTRHIDLAILSTIAAAVPRLGVDGGWDAHFGRELNATEDRPHFVLLTDAAGHGEVLPIVAGRHLEPFRVNGSEAQGIPTTVAGTLLDARRTFARTRLAYRDVASATNRITLIAALLPRGTVATHTVFSLKTPLGHDAQYVLLALLNSLVANYLVRLQVTTHVTTALMARLPVPRPLTTSPQFAELAAFARSLERTGLTGHDSTYARLNATVAALYHLTPDHYRHVVNTFPLLSQELRDACVNAYAVTCGPQSSQRAQRKD